MMSPHITPHAARLFRRHMHTPTTNPHPQNEASPVETPPALKIAPRRQSRTNHINKSTCLLTPKMQRYVCSLMLHFFGHDAFVAITVGIPTRENITPTSRRDSLLSQYYGTSSSSQELFFAVVSWGIRLFFFAAFNPLVVQQEKLHWHRRRSFEPPDKSRKKR